MIEPVYGQTVATYLTPMSLMSIEYFMFMFWQKGYSKPNSLPTFTALMALIIILV